jgi:UDP-N-acetylglucosamine 4,6-dehydratase/5-epimerase
MKILVTGGTGSLGTVLCQELLARGHQLTILNKDSHKQAIARKALPNDVRFYLADICDRDAVYEACHGQDVVLHAAAIKRIEAGEWAPQEMMRVNVEGTRNVANACRAAHVKRCLLISSDKATGPTYYGTTKRLAEGIWLERDVHDQWFGGLRYGNVVNSAGSVWHLWHEAKAKGMPLLVRKPEPTRFILDLKEAVGLVLETLKIMGSLSQCVFLPSNLPAFSVWDLACEIEPDASQWQMMPYVTNERQHEQLIANDECAKKVNDVLWATCNRYEMKDTDRARFSSNTAPRISGREVVERMSCQN